MQIHPSQRRVSCEHCRKHKAKCQRTQVEDYKCLRCTISNLACDSGQQRKVGRPKRKEVDLSSTGRTSPAAKRRKETHISATNVTAVNKSGIQHDISARTCNGTPGLYDSSSRSYTEVNSPSLSDAQDRPFVFPSISRTTDEGWSRWPTFMTDLWYRNIVPAAVSSGFSEDSEIDRSPYGNATQITTLGRVAYGTGPISLDLMEQALCRGSLAWINPEHLAMRKRVPLPFGIGRPPAYYIHENGFSSDAADVSTSDGHLDGTNVIARLTRLLCGLRLRRAMVHANTSKLSLNILIHRSGPFFIASHSLCEYVTAATQELVQFATSLLCGSHSTDKPDEQLSAHLITTVMDIYCHILSFFQLFLEHLTAGAERQGDNPVIPIPDLTFNGVVLTGPCTQGVLFSSSSFYLLERLEIILGLKSASGDTSLLSTTQIELLYDKLDRSNDLAQTKGIMRPADLKKLFARVSTVLEQLSASEQ